VRTYGFALLCCLALASCGGAGISSKRIDNIVKVMMHEPGSYSLISQENEKPELTPFVFESYDIHLLADVPEGKPMYAELSEQNGEREKYWKTATIHIHSHRDINGAGWNHGKFGKGTTTEVENK
jgi:hypothetical protein